MKFYGGLPSPNYCLIRIIETSQVLEIRSHTFHREEKHYYYISFYVNLVVKY